MWDRVGFGALVLATVLDAVWLATLLSEDATADATSARPEQSAQSGPAPSEQPAEPVQTDKPTQGDPVDPPAGDVPNASAAPAGVPSGAQAVLVSKHTDGDTLHVVPKAGSVVEPGVDIAVRLLEIDTPESVDPNSPVECYAKKASAQLARLLPIGSTAWVAPDRELLDRYARTLLYLWTDTGEFVNLSMVEGGYAEAVLFEPNDMYIRQLQAAERRARRAGLGMWTACQISRSSSRTP